MLDNGQIWQQALYAYTYRYAYRPKVLIYRSAQADQLCDQLVGGFASPRLCRLSRALCALHNKMIEFTLVYRGELRPSGKPSHKHAVRQRFHRQLRHLWHHPAKMAPGSLSHIRPDLSDPGLLRPVGPFKCLPVISENGYNVAEVQVTLLHPEPAGSILTRTGDIDNRLKTLFDAMKMPSVAELPRGKEPGPNEIPFFCVVEDDHLITTVSVDTKRLLDPAVTLGYVNLVVTVRGRHVSEFGLWVARR